MMGNPYRYYFNNEFIIRNPEINLDVKRLKVISESKFENNYDKAIIDLYTAPDVILSYSSGNTTKDEWRRYDRLEFKGLRLENIYEMEYNHYATFSFEEYERTWDESLSEVDIPLGKFRGMSSKEIVFYKKLNFFNG